MIEIRMPRLSEGMVDGKLLLWNVAVGDYVNAGDQLAEVEADKANMEIEAPVPGVVCAVHGKPGETIAVDTILVELREEPSHETSAVETDMSVAQPKPQTAPEPTLDSPLERRQKQFEKPGQEA